MEDAREVERHPFFANIPFRLYEEKKVPPLFKPELDSDTDTRYFDTEFTNEPVCVTPSGNTTTNFILFLIKIIHFQVVLNR
jgi:RAC serine/threonine-protein kinase